MSKQIDLKPKDYHWQDTPTVTDNMKPRHGNITSVTPHVCAWGNCGYEFDINDTVYRYVEGYGVDWGALGGKSEPVYLCEACAGEPEEWSIRRWLNPKPCAICKRPVRCSSSRYPPLLVTCSQACANALRAKQAREQRRAKRVTIACQHCEEHFLPPRKNSVYCTNKCRQAAYRKRQAIAFAE